MAHAVSRPGRTSGFFAGITTFFARALDMMERRRNFGRVYDELASLSDRELNDIGLSRSDIVDIAWQSSRA